MPNDNFPRVLVTGATGTTGHEVVHQLLSRGSAVVAMARGTSDGHHIPAGIAGVAIADFDDAASLARAVSGISAAYLVTPSSASAEAQQIRFMDAAARAGVAHIVLLSQLGAYAGSPGRFLRYHAAAEAHLRGSGMAFTILRPNLSLQSLAAFQDSISSEGRFYAPVGNARVSAIDMRDIGEVAAITLLDPAHRGETYDLTGPEALTHTEIADILSVVIGRRIAFTDVDPATFAAELSGVVPAWQVGGLLEDYAHYARGEAAALSDAVATISGRPARTATQYAYDYADEFRMRFA